MKRVAIVGGGIAGLSAAYYLEQAKRGGAEIAWTLYEKSDRFGGVIKTDHREGFVLEAGPDSFLTIKPDGAQLCRELGIASDLISSNDADRKTYIVTKGRLVPIPEGLEFMVPTRVAPMAATPLFSFSTKLRMAAELMTRRRSNHADDDRDESVAGFVRRHFGQQMVERVAEPLLAGVYGGNAEQLSVHAVLPRFVEMEREHGSLVRATLKARRQRAQSNRAPQSLFTSLRSGMQQLVDSLVAVLPVSSLRTRQSTFLDRAGSQWQIKGDVDDRFDCVFLATPAPASATLLESLQPQLASLLEKIPYTSSAAVALAYDRAELPPGHGFLVPATEGQKMLACTFVHRKFADRAPEGAALLRCFISSSRVPDLLTYSDAAVQEMVQTELRDILGLRASPRFVRVFRWNCALPQYETGHLSRVAEMEQMLRELPGISIIGNSFYGIGIPDCIRSARKAAETITSGVLRPVSA